MRTDKKAERYIKRLERKIAFWDKIYKIVNHLICQRMNKPRS